MRSELDAEREEALEDAARAGPDEAEEEDERAAADARARQRFDAVAACMEQILAPNPALRFEAGLSQGDERGLEELYAAARGHEDGRHVPGLTRMKKLNQALALLRPALVAGLEPSWPEERKLYEALAEQVGELRHRITQRIYVEAVGFGGGEVAQDEGEDQDDDHASGEAEALARAERALELFTDELAFSAGARGSARLVALAGAARRLRDTSAKRGKPAAAAELRAALDAVLTHPEAAVAELEFAEPEALAAEIREVAAKLGDEPPPKRGFAAAAEILEHVARAANEDAS